MTKTSDVWPNGVPEVGQSAKLSREITKNDIELLAQISSDRNLWHYDEDVANSSPFGDIIIQGGITNTILNAVVTTELLGPGTVFLKVNWSFKSSVKLGDTITGEVTVKKVRKDKPITELEIRVITQDGIIILEGNAVCYTTQLLC